MTTIKDLLRYEDLRLLAAVQFWIMLRAELGYPVPADVQQYLVSVCQNEPERKWA